jgi:hypothetical protein
MANARTTTATTAKGATPKATPPKGASTAPKGKPAKGASTAPKADGNTAPPVGGYVLLRTANPARPGSNRAHRWPMLAQHAGQPNGVAALAATLKAGGQWATAKGMLRWCQGKGYVAVCPSALPPKGDGKAG